ncbi:MAG: hypothetical protein ACYCV6_03075 [Steroidobacteraceae bacterium]
MNAAPWCDRPGVGGLGLLWRASVVVPALLLLAVVVLYSKSLEWLGR